MVVYATSEKIPASARVISGAVPSERIGAGFTNSDVAGAKCTSSPWDARMRRYADFALTLKPRGILHARLHHITNQEIAMDKSNDRVSRERADGSRENGSDSEHDEEIRVNSSTTEADEPNPARTTTSSWWTAPKFGSAGSGGAELEPGPESD